MQPVSSMQDRSAVFRAHPRGALGHRPAAPRALATVTSRSSSTMPSSTQELVSLAAQSVRRALDQGHTRQRLELLLPAQPLPRGIDAGGSEAAFQASCNLTHALLTDLASEGPPLCKRLDCGAEGEEGEPCAVYYPDSRDFAAVVGATATNLGALKGLVAEAERPLLLINPQWQAGQFLSDFGWGETAFAAHRFLDSFHPSFLLREQRLVGVPWRPQKRPEGVPQGMVQGGSGTVVRTLRAFPGLYEAYIMEPNGGSTLAAAFVEAPSFAQLEEAVQRSRARAAG